MPETTIALTINDIQAAMRTRGSHWWDPDTMRHFGTRYCGPLYSGAGGVYFVTSDRAWDDGRAYTVRGYDPESAEVRTVGNLCGHKTLARARTAARRAAAGLGMVRDVVRDQSRHVPVTIPEQVAYDLARHGCVNVTDDDVRELIACAYVHAYWSEQACNSQHGADGAERNIPRVVKRINRVCDRIGCKPLLGGDPRGCTFKLILPDGHTNDFGSEGYCVPTSVRADD